MRLRKNYSRRTDALKVLKAYLQILTNAKELTGISYHTYQHIAKAYKTLSDYGPNTQVHKSELGKIEFIDPESNHMVSLHILIEELQAIDFSRIFKHRTDCSSNKVEGEIPRITRIFLDERNSESIRLLIKNIDDVIEYYNMLNLASKNE